MSGMGKRDAIWIGYAGSRLWEHVESGKITREQAEKFVKWIKKRIERENKKKRIELCRFRSKWLKEHRKEPDFERNESWYADKYEKDLRVYEKDFSWSGRLDECFEEIEKSKRVFARMLRK
jgi:hypothetical protein